MIRLLTRRATNSNLPIVLKSTVFEKSFMIKTKPMQKMRRKTPHITFKVVVIL